METKVKDLQPDLFEQETAEGNAIVMIGGVGCGNCKMQLAILERIAPTLQGWKLFKLDSGTAMDIAGKFNVTTLPTTLVFKSGEHKETLVGLKPQPVLVKMLCE